MMKNKFIKLGATSILSVGMLMGCAADEDVPDVDVEDPAQTPDTEEGDMEPTDGTDTEKDTKTESPDDGMDNSEDNMDMDVEDTDPAN